MAMMARMRSLAPAFIITVGALFVLFMVISDSNVLEALGGGRTNFVGSVNGDEISYQEFQAALDKQREMKKQQTGEDIPEDQTDQFREQVWDALVTQKLLEQEVERLGITVTDDEVRDIILGDNPPQFLKQNFIDSTGQFNREAYENAIYDPQNEKILLQAEDYVRQNRLNEKLQTMLLASITVSEDEVMRRFNEQNIYMNGVYTLFPTTLFPDSVLNITDEDLKEYYEDNPDKFKVNAQRKIKFVLFKNVPSKTDTNLVVKNLENVKVIAENDTAKFKSFVDIYSDQPYSIDTVAVNTLSQEAVNQFRTSDEGSIIGPVPSPQGYALYHLLEVIPVKEKFVRASHILINQIGDDEKNLAEANRIYQEILNGADFKQMAKQYSKDPGSAQKGGDLGWFGKGMMIKEFEDACFNGKTGEIQKPLKTNFGYHIIKVTDQSTNKFVVENIINQVKISATTKDDNYNAAGDFAYLADKNDFEKEAELMNYNIQESSPFMENSPSIPGLGSNKRLVKFCFDNGLNDISEVFKVQTGFVVVKISEVIPEGVQDFEEVKQKVKFYLTNDKRFDKLKELAAGLLQKADNDINKMPSLDKRIKVQATGRFNAQTSIPNIGKDYAFINASLSLDKGQTSEPVKSNRGYYIIHLTEKTGFDSTAYATQSTTIRNSIIQEKTNAYLNTWLNNLKQEANIIDNRHLFYTY